MSVGDLKLCYCDRSSKKASIYCDGACFTSPYQYTSIPMGCICPPGANKECENIYCPRKNKEKR